ncbi:MULTISPECIES: diiron oxygenase [unclassified Streptomyces]|uniref:diiron oxygenase n=1 Tax=unclassified Streptomyces TaxID=2593676 RepID=UPI0034303A83
MRHPLRADLRYLPPESLSLYETPLWQTMTQCQRIELSRQELASQVGMGTWFELCNLRLFSHHLQRKDPTDPRTRYALTEGGHETRHIRMFARLLTTCGAPVYGPPAYLRRSPRRTRSSRTSPRSP